MKRYRLQQFFAGIVALLLISGSGDAGLPHMHGNPPAPPFAPAPVFAQDTGTWPNLAPGTTLRVSVAADGAEADGASGRLSISADGRYIVFNSAATNLVDSVVYGPKVLLRDMQTGQYRHIAGAYSASYGVFSFGKIAGNGQAVAFIVPTVKFFFPLLTHVRDLQTDTEEKVAAAPRSDLPGVDKLALSGNGRYVASSDWSGEVMVYDRVMGQTTRVSVASDGTQGDNSSFGAAISHDGRYVAFASLANNLVPTDTDTSCVEALGAPCADVFVHDRMTGQTALVSVASDGTKGNGASGYLTGVAISANGRYVAFGSGASNLVSGDTNGIGDVFVHDRQTGQTTRVSVASDGTESNDNSRVSAISADGRYLVFISSASNLVAGDTNQCEDDNRTYLDGHCPDVFVHDQGTGATVRVSTATDGTEGNNAAAFYDPAAITANGQMVVFASHASNLVPDDTNGMQDIFLKVLPITTLTINHQTSQPGSVLTLTGTQFPPNGTATVTVNATSLGTVTMDANGAFSFLLKTDQADAGYYTVQVQANEFVHPATHFWLDPTAPLQPAEGEGTELTLPAGIARTRFIFLPLLAW